MKHLHITILLSLLMSMVGVQTFAHDIAVENAQGVTIYYNFINDNTELAVSCYGNYGSYSFPSYGGEVILPESVIYNGLIYSVTSISYGAFSGCTFLTSIIIPLSVTSIGDEAFTGCSGLTSIEIPSNVTSIGYAVFSGCSGLTSIEIPSNVTSIGYAVFSNCSGLTSIEIPENVTWIDDDAFQGCSGLTSIEIPSSVTSIGNGAFRGCSGLTSIEIPEGVTWIGEYVFEGCSCLTSITIPGSVTTIGDNTFSGCSGPTSIILSEGVESISNSAFSGCSSLTAITIPSSVSNVDEGTFEDCKGLTTLTINTSTIGSWFSEMDNLSEVIIGNSVTEIGDNAFSGCINLSSVIIGSNVVSIGNNAFDGCKLTSIELPSSLTTIGQYAFIGCNLTSIEIPSSVTTIGDYAFWLCEGLTSATIHEGVTNIGNNAFEGCYNLTSIEIPSSVVTIGSLAFYNCHGLTSVIISEGVRVISDEAFECCDGLTSITIPSSVTSIGYAAFSGCSGLTSITVNSDNTIYDSRDNCNAIIETCSNKLIAGCRNTIIPLSVTSIGDCAFSFCGLTSIEIPSSVTNIGDGAFEGCSGLTSITIPESVTSIGWRAFAECTSLTTVQVGMLIPVPISSDTFSNYSNATLYVPAGSKAAYEAANYWKDFKEIVELESQKYTLEISTDGGAFNPELSHLYDRDGNEYDVTDFSNNEFDAGSYIRIVPSIRPYNVYYIREIIVNGESVGTWTENTAPDEYVIESLSCNTTVEFKTYYIEDYRTLGCIANGPGNVEMYRNGNYVGTTTTQYEHINLITGVFEVGDVLKLVFVPDEGSTLTGFSGGQNDSVIDEVGLFADVTDNTYTTTFPVHHDNYEYDIRCFTATFEGPEPQTNNVLSATAPTILTGQEASLSLNLTNEDEIIMTEFYMQLPNGITIEEDEDGYPIVTINSERENKHVIEVSKNSEGLYHFLCYSSKNNAFKGNEGELLSMNLICAEGVAAGTYTATVKDIIMSDIDRNELTQSDFTFNITVIDVAMGDANGDGRINGMDIVEMVDYIMERPSNSFVFAAADLTGDGKVNGMDLVELVSLVMAQGATQAAPPTTLPRREGTLQAEKFNEGTLTLKGNENGGLMLGIENPDEFILAQMVVEVSDGMLTDVTTDAKHDVVWSQIGVGRYAVLAYSTRNRSFTTNDCLLTFLGCEGNVTVKEVMLVDANREAKFFADVTYDSVTGITAISNNFSKPTDIYSLSGKLLKKNATSTAGLKKGIYIINHEKIVVK